MKICSAGVEHTMEVMSKCYYSCYLKSHSLTSFLSPTQALLETPNETQLLLEFFGFELGWKQLSKIQHRSRHFAEIISLTSLGCLNLKKKKNHAGVSISY